MNATVLLRLDIIKESSHAKYLLSNCLLSMYLHLLIQGSYYLYLLGQKSNVINGLKSFNMENCTFILESSTEWGPVSQLHLEQQVQGPLSFLFLLTFIANGSYWSVFCKIRVRQLWSENIKTEITKASKMDHFDCKQ